MKPPFDPYRISRWLRAARLYGPMHGLVQKARGSDAEPSKALDVWRDELVRTGAGIADVAATANKRVLVVGWPSFASAAMQLPIVTAFIKAGYKPTVVLPSRADRAAIDLYRLFGVTDFDFWTNLRSDLWPERPTSQFKAPADLLAFRYGGVRVGRYTLSTMMRNLRRGRFDFSTEADRNLLDSWILRGVDAVSYGRILLERWKPDALLLNDQGYIPLGPLFEMAIHREVPVYSWNAAHRDNAIILKRYGQHNLDKHPVSLSADSWNSMLDGGWSDDDWQALSREIVHCYHSGQWYSEVGTQFDKLFPSRDELVTRLKLSPDRPTILVFPHIFWDGTLFWGSDLFADYEEFFSETAKVAYQTPSANWIIKIHPANLVKNNRDGVDSPPGELRVLKELGPIPEHIRILDASSDISTLSLFSVGDICVTVRRTAGLEAACFGLTTITAGTGRYNNLGFTIDPVSTKEFTSLLGAPENIPKMSADAIDRARRYLSGILLRRPTPYHCINFRYAHDAKASLRLDFGSGQSLINSPEVSEMEQYIRSGTEDFFKSGRFPPPDQGSDS